jgi:glucosylglycerate synthase
VWETDVAREGIDVWMTVEATLGGARLGQATLGPKYHRTPDSLALIEAKFLQEVGALFRMGYLHERRWRAAESLAPGISTFGEPVQRPLPPLEEAQEAEEVAPAPLRDQWQAILMPPTLDAVIALFEEGAGASFNDQLWARVVYDFLIVYNLGEGDPDKVVTSLFPLYQLRWRTLKAEAARHPDPQVALDRLIERQAAVFNEEVDYLFQQWTGYVSPEQRALWRTLGRRKRQR